MELKDASADPTIDSSVMAPFENPEQLVRRLLGAPPSSDEEVLPKGQEENKMSHEDLTTLLLEKASDWLDKDWESLSEDYVVPELRKIPGDPVESASKDGRRAYKNIEKAGRPDCTGDGRSFGRVPEIFLERPQFGFCKGVMR